jgi:hypothetical protein
LQSRFGLGAKVHVVTNGYNAEEQVNVEPHHFGHVAMVYAGIFYPPVRVITPVMAALQHLKQTSRHSSRAWYFHYYGPHEALVRVAAMQYAVMDRVILHGKVPRLEALAAVRGADLAVVITSIAEQGTLADNGMITGKLFEAVGLGTPVLLIAPAGSDARAVVAATASGQSFTASETAGIGAFLTEVIEGRVARPTIPEAYAWQSIAKNMAGVLQVVLRTEARYAQAVRILDDDAVLDATP